MVDMIRKYQCFAVFIQIYVQMTLSQSLNGFQFDAGHVLDALDGIQDFFEGGGENCKFKCPRGQRVKPNPRHKISSDGCGSLGIKFDTDHLPGVTECCNRHDVCYDTCNNDRKDCDQAFQSCLGNICQGLKKNKREYDGCKVTTQLMAAGASSMGCSSYRNAQAKACLCVPLDYQKPNEKEEL